VNPPGQPVSPCRVRIDHVGAAGDGVGRLADGAPVYLPLTLPGELITAGALRRSGTGWHAAVETIDEPSPARALPPCRHFGRCGGCVLQHWQDAAYRTWKSGLLEGALRAAGFALPGALELVAGLPGERRRLDFAIRRVGGRIILGLHGSRSTEVVDLTDCSVLHPTLLALLAPLRALLQGLRAIRRQGAAVINLLDAGPDLLLRGDAAPSLEDRIALTDFARTHGLPRVSWSHGGDRPGGDGAETICLLRPATTVLSGITVRPPPGAFLQATEAGERAIVDAVLRGLPARLPARGRIAELYAGCGTLTFALAGARAGALRVAAWEGGVASIAALQQGINQGGLSGRVTATRRDLTRQPLSVKEFSGFAAVVLDPPHAGAVAQIATIAAAGVPTVVYVSCNPATLGRDAKVLKGAGYVLADATAIDQFLWSARMEAVCVFRRG
jgi:23S rRNA (uracil1939-C5)-methyltransferase